MGSKLCLNINGSIPTTNLNLESTAKKLKIPFLSWTLQDPENFEELIEKIKSYKFIYFSFAFVLEELSVLFLFASFSGILIFLDSHISIHSSYNVLNRTDESISFFKLIKYEQVISPN
jgi:hypothetical protein